MSLLSVKNLSVYLENRIIIDDVSFDLEKGDVVAIIGPNGAGKTTLFKTLMKFLPYKGEIVWQSGIKIGYAPQGLDINRRFPLAVREIFSIAEFSGNRNDLDQAILDTLKLVKVDHLVDRSMNTLSGGEFQRVLIALALFDNPDVLLFDEPTSDVDIAGQETIYSHLKHIAKEKGITLLLISHDISMVVRYANKVFCLNKELKCQGEPKDILTADVLADLYGQEVHLYHHKDHQRISQSS